MTTGEERAPGILARTEPGSRAWEAGVQPGWKIADIDGTKDPYFDQMRVAVALSDAGRDIHFTFVDRHGETHTRTMEPIRDENGIVPIIGVGSPLKMELSPARYRERMLGSAVRISSPAAHARALPLERGDLPLEATDPSKDNAVTPLTSPQGPWMELCSRLMQSKTQPFQLIVRRGEKNQTLDVPVGGFDFEDFIVSTTDPKTPEQPYNLLDLPLDPTRPSTDGLTDPFEFRERMTRLAGKPVVLGVRRGGTDGEVIKILVPPAYYRDFGMRMKMGKVASVRRDSPASVAKVQKADTITGVKLHYEKETIVLSEKQRDPIRLPFELARIIEGDSKRNPEKWQVELTVQRLVDRNQLSTEQLKLTGWQSQFNLSGEQPGNASSPMSIPQLGIAYWVESTVNHVEKGSPADKAGILVGDVIEKIRVKERGNKPGETKWSNRVEMASTRGKQKVHDQWATWFFRIQDLDHPEVQFSIRRVDGETKTAVEVQVPAGSESLIPLPDETWPQEDRGLALMMDTRRHKAETLVQSLAFGLMRTKDFILQMYANLKSLLTGRISTKSLGGPIEIATQAYNFAGEDLAMFGLFLAMISINLAVVNFLPIPILDGGHMMFLIYEKIRGQKPSEAVQVVATYIGLAAILGLMCFVFYLDMQRRGWL
jgi:regulator of sigma E protease